MNLSAKVKFAAALSILVPVNFACQLGKPDLKVDVPTTETARDEALSRSVRDKLLADKKADLSAIKVISNDGKVYLTGTVRNLDARQQAVKIAWEVPGVQSVINTLEE